MALDFRPNFQIDPNLFSSLANRYSGGLGAFQQQYDRSSEKAQALSEKQRWVQAINDLMKNPNVPDSAKQIAPMIAVHPELAGQLMPEILKQQQPKQKPEYSAVSGMISEQGEPLIIDKFTGEVKPAKGIKAKSTGFGSTMGPIRKAQYTLQDLPSNQGPSTAGGAAYQVKVAARQGMNIIARAGSAQRTGIAGADLVRAVTRVAPTDEGMKTANFSNNLITRWSSLKQKITADPGQADNPKIRKEMYDIFKEMDESATPFIKNQLDDMADAGFPVTESTRKRQLGMTLPIIPFEEGGSQEGSYTDPQKEARYQAWKKGLKL